MNRFINRQTKSLSRRTLLKGAGAALALPWLEAMLPKRLFAASTNSHPVRLAALFMPNGVREDQWTPTGQGEKFELSSTLKPLEKLKGEILVPTNLWNQGSDYGDGHYVKTSGFLTCTTINKSLGYDLNSNGISIDQIAARSVANKTPLPSLELAIDPVTIGVDTNVGYTRVYGSHIAWNKPTRPLAREINPRLVFERLFRINNPSSKNNISDSLLLDRVLDDAKQLRSQVGNSDKSRIDDYLESVRALERRIEQTSQQSAQAWHPRREISLESKPERRPEEHPERVRLMLDMIALAFQTDSTRVCTFMFGNAVSNTNFSFIDGVKGGHHSLSHHENKEENLAQYQRIGQWHIEQYAYLLNKLKSFKEGENTVLDNSMILFGSGLRDGNKHSPHNLPIVLSGRAGGRINTGQHLTYEKDTPLSNLYCCILEAFGAPVKSFADSTGKLKGILS